MKKLPGSFLFRFFRVALVLAISLLIGYWLFESRPVTEKKKLVKAPPSVKVLTVSPKSRIMKVEAFGTVRPRKIVKIPAEVAGRIDYINPSFLEGGFIRRGELLVRIDQSSYRLDREACSVKIRQARADIENLKQNIENLKNDIRLSEINADLALKELERVKQLNKNQFASKTSLDKAEQQHISARTQLQGIKNMLALTGTLMKQKKAALAMAEVNFQKADLALNKTGIKSDFNGFVLDKHTEVGEYVNPGSIIGSIYEKDSLDVDVGIPLEEIKWISPLLKEGKIPRARVRAVSADESIGNSVWDAKVARLKAGIDEKTRTLPITLEIIDKNEKDTFDLKPGTFVKCSITGEVYKDIFVIPRHLLKKGNIVLTVNDESLKMKQVTVLRKFQEKVYIEEGLKKGDKIIYSPLPNPFEGMKLKIKHDGK